MKGKYFTSNLIIDRFDSFSSISWYELKNITIR